ncbi:acyltransferase ChoActase/COT/CPT [Wallemia mellicola]|uniref:Acyltransferase ChoActase/COT/CPT n=1 Tax=Wallemia mellicola TaxID=1708541 RepID=A0AB38MVF0_9BASI|nr:acyltransferase ChoActase/COT/CPT [Wallemia mellicola]
MSRLAPRLPIPGLESSLEKYLKSLEPFIEDDNHTRLHLRTLADDFREGLGKKLQARLKDVEKASPTNWLDDRWWIKVAYHTDRSPLLINSNWWLLYKDDPSIPDSVKKNKNERGFTNWQILRAAWLTRGLLHIKSVLDNGEQLPDLSKAARWFGPRANRLFGMTRIPQYDCDELTHVPLPNLTKHIVVFAKSQTFKVDVIDSKGAIQGWENIAKSFQSITDNLGNNLDADVGVMTSDDRDRWTKNREHLKLLSQQNETNLALIESALFAVCLDDYTLPPRRKEHDELDGHMVNIAGGINGNNRWFDKSMSLIVENNGRAGMNGEHSFVEALVPSIVADYTLYENLPNKDSLDIPQKACDFERLRWVLDGALVREAEGANERAKRLLDDSEPSELLFDEYGIDWMKNVAGLAPDAFIQMALQLTWFRNQGYATATYETASTRIFDNGRTETLRTLTSESKRFVESMMSKDSDVRYENLLEATKVHSRSMREASTGKAFDRHLLGLRLLLRPGEGHEFFNNKYFKLSSEWKLSTSGLSAGPRFNGTGFGAVYPDGYGINYMAGPHELKFGIESKVSCPKTSTYDFKKDLLKSLREMRAINHSSSSPTLYATSASTLCTDVSNERNLTCSVLSDCMRCGSASTHKSDTSIVLASSVSDVYIKMLNAHGSSIIGKKVTDAVI